MLFQIRDHGRILSSDENSRPQSVDLTTVIHFSGLTYGHPLSALAGRAACSHA